MPSPGTGGYVRITVLGDKETAAYLMAVGRELQDASHKLLLAYGAILQRQVKANASGPPGPQKITGDYVRSIRRKSTRKKGLSRVEVGTDEPEGWRLEQGFHGTDSLGRTYHNPPLPHFGPAFDAVKPQVEEAFESMVNLL